MVSEEFMKKAEYYLDSIYELIEEWKNKKEKTLEGMADIMLEIANFSSSLESSIRSEMSEIAETTDKDGEGKC